MDINNSNEQIKQSVSIEPRVLTSYQAHCTDHQTDWSGNCYSNKKDSEREAILHNLNFHFGFKRAIVSSHEGNCPN